MNRQLTSSILLILALACQPAFSREKKNCPEESEVEAALGEAGQIHRNVTEIRELRSHKTEDTYFHLFSGKVDLNYRVIVFNNQAQYLGYYDTGDYNPYQYNPQHKVVVCVDKYGDEMVIPIGNMGPWEKVKVTPRISPKGPFDNPRIATFTGSARYKAPVVSRETRIWIFGKDDIELKAKLADIDKNMVYLQNADKGYIVRFNKSFLSSKDKKYISSQD